MARIYLHYGVGKMVFMGAITGVLVGTVGATFQMAIAWMNETQKYYLELLEYNLIYQYLFAIALSTSFLLIAIALVRNIAPESAGSGVQEIEGALDFKRELRWWRVLPVKFVAGVMALSSGLVLGREGPTIQMGGSIGQIMHSAFRLNKQGKHIMIAAGAGAGLAAAFNAPLAGILFVVEEMKEQFEYNFKSLQAVILACVASDITLRLFMGQGADIPMTHFDAPPLSSLWVFVLFGIIGFFFNRYLLRFNNFMMLIKRSTFWLMIIGIGILTGICSVSFPSIIGGGYEIMPAVLTESMGMMALMSIFVLRLFTTWGSYSTGVPGGIFAPMLALGTTFGMLFGEFVQMVWPGLISHPGMFSVAGMSALFTATVGAPLTGIVLVVEMTMNYALILPLILTCLCATLTAKYMGGERIYTKLLSRTLILKQRPGLYIRILKQGRKRRNKKFKIIKKD
jgi:CIC family chloride channel protein